MTRPEYGKTYTIHIDSPFDVETHTKVTEWKIDYETGRLEFTDPDTGKYKIVTFRYSIEEE